MNENLTDIQNKTSHLDCQVLQLAGSLYLALLLVGLISNVTLIWTFFKHKKELLQNIYIIYFAIIISSLLGTIVVLPILVITAFSCS